MKEMVAQTSTHKHRPQEKAIWYRALALNERLPVPLAHDTPPASTQEAARKKLRRWKEQAAFQKNELFSERLAMDGLTEDDLLTLLGEPIEAVQERVSTPSWLKQLLDAFAKQTDDFIFPEIQIRYDPNHVAFLTLLKPLLQDGLTRLQAGIHTLTQTYTTVPFEQETLLSFLFTHVLGNLLTKFVRTAVLELNVARVEGRLQSEKPEERFREFIQLLSQQEGILALFEEYTTLARQLVETIDSWVARELELLGRLCADWEEIRATFIPGQDPGQLVAINEGAGDTHRGGRSVTILTWSSGFRLVYKPRSMAIDIHFQELLSWFNAKGQKPALRTFTLLNKEQYGWVEFLQARTCTSKAEVERFYQRQGSYLALLYALEATDFHAENLIAMGEHPMLIDLESLFHPHVSIPAEQKFGLPGFELIGHSVQRVGMLPQRMWSNEEHEGVDISGLGGQAGQMMPTPSPRWVGVGTDQMRLSRERVEIDLSQNRPSLNGKDIQTLEYSGSILKGFSSTYRLLIQHREELLTQMLPRFAHDDIRCLLRPTRTYGMLFSDCFHPNMLRDALDRDRLLDRLWLGVEFQPYLKRVIAAEQDDLRRGDIPLFGSRADSLDLFTSDGERIPAFFEESGITLATRHIQQLDEEDLERQLWIIHASFTSTILGSDGIQHKTLHLQPAKTLPTREHLLNSALAVGERLKKLSLASEETVGWLGVNPVKEREWHLLATEEDLYSGTSGIALFLAYLGVQTSEERYTTLARTTLPALRHIVAQKKKHNAFGGIGTFSGVGSYIYLLSHLGTLWHEPALFEEAEELVKLLPASIAVDKNFDVMGGSAGCIASLLSLFQVAPSDAIGTAAVLCGDHLLACAEKMERGIGWRTPGSDIPLTGFAHGNAGIALNLLRLFEASKEERFRDGALAAMEYERGLFSAQHCNWPDLRVDPAEERKGAKSDEEKFMVAWCHGAPGIGLGRLGSLKMLDDEAIRSEIDAALDTTIAAGFGMNHSLCHGDMGNIDTVLVAAQVLDRPEYREGIDKLSAMLLDSIEKQGWVTGVPLGVETPGLMVGLAGTGYALLRLADPERVPSLLMGEPPRKAE